MFCLGLERSYTINFYLHGIINTRMFQLTTNLEARLGQLKSYLLRIYQLFEMIAKAKFSNGFILSPPKYFLSARLTINRLYPSISSPLRIRGVTPGLQPSPLSIQTRKFPPTRAIDAHENVRQMFSERRTEA